MEPLALLIGWDNILGPSLAKNIEMNAVWVKDSSMARKLIKDRKYSCFLINYDESYDGRSFATFLDGMSINDRRKVVLAGTYPDSTQLGYAKCMNVGTYLQRPFSFKLLSKVLKEAQNCREFTFIREGKDALDYLIIPSDWCTSLVEMLSFSEGPKKSICLSSQTGCLMGCKFCATGTCPSTADTLNVRNIFVEEMHHCLDAALRYHLGNSRKIRINISGMGEPTLNLYVIKFMEELNNHRLGKYSYKFSTVGLVKPLARFLDEMMNKGIVSDIQLSLHFAIEKKRHQYMPATRSNSLSEIFPIILQAVERMHSSLVINVTPLLDINDGSEDMDALRNLLFDYQIMRLMSDGRCRLRISQFNENYFDNSFQPTTSKRYREMVSELKRDFVVQEFESLGKDLNRACGQQTASFGDPIMRDTEEDANS